VDIASSGGHPIAGRSGEPADRSSAVVALLMSHGVSSRAARNTARIGEALRQRMAETRIEFAVLIDDASGDQVGETLSGIVDQVDLHSHMDAMQPGRRYLHVHTHPASSSFSDDDLTVLLAHVEMRTIVAVGSDGTWYFLSRVRGRPTVDPVVGTALWNVHFGEVAAADDLLIARGILSDSEALRREAHETLVRLAPEIGLRYDHLGPLY
jgi:uncharacterized protein with PIN domain